MDYQELIERLRFGNTVSITHVAANTIESLLAANERLKHNLAVTEQTMREYQELAAKRLEEIERLKEIEQTNDTLLEQLGDKNAALLDQVAGLTKKHNALKKTVFTNTNREVTIRNRFFTAHDDGVADQNFDFDAYLHIDGDFIDDEKKRYAQMIACTLNDYGRLATELAKYRDAPIAAYGVLEDQGSSVISWDFIAGWPEAAHEHINDAIQIWKDSGDFVPKYSVVPLIIKPGEEK